MAQPHQIFSFNPVSITVNQIYGTWEGENRDWVPGVFAEMLKKANDPNNNYSSLINFDGPMDANWVESMNSLMDDSKVLTLGNGENIHLNSKCKLVFEVD